MKSTKILLIESGRKNGVMFAASLKRRYEVLVAHSGKQGLELAESEHPDVIVLNAESLRTSGDRIAARLRAQLNKMPIIHIRPEAMDPHKSPADVLLFPPFTARKLINRVERFGKAPEAEVLSVGPFKLSLQQQTLMTPWGEKKLTPKLVELMTMFLQHKDETLERKDIMQTIWKTDYMGDTRTLDVHIRWLRKVVEPEPRKPRYITTVRGVGYCFKLPESESAAQAHARSATNAKPSQESGAGKKANPRADAKATPAPEGRLGA